ncbi:hypothetical protein IV203_028429 [Nitzschia inconspicua]|uniref:Uncharacterized protein n=1 Tax=Nitzschia inconspicua TaxID=303405 RepID=A0A9K3Q282_9STRA|nr:hypothetical protein IV203_028429 [Nitzschia inconspicua]
MSNNTAPNAFSSPADIDDATVITGKPYSRSSATKVWKEMVVQLRFQTKDDLRVGSRLPLGIHRPHRHETVLADRPQHQN